MKGSDKNKLLGWVLISMIFFGWLFYRAQTDYKENLKRAPQDSTAQTEAAGDGIAPPGDVSVTPPAETGSQVSAAESQADASVQEKGTVDSTAAGTMITAAAEERELVVETNKFTMSLSSKGAKITSAIIKDLKGDKDSAYPQLIPPDRGGALTLRLENKDLSEVLWQVTDSVSDSIRVADRQVKIHFSYYLTPAQQIVRTYTFFPDSHFVRHEFSSSASPGPFALDWNAGLRETERVPEGKGLGLNYGFFSEVVINTGAAVLRETFSKKKTFNESSGVIRWVGLRKKYVAALLNFHANTSHQIIALPLLREDEKKSTTHTYKLIISSRSYEKGFLDFDFVLLPLHHQQVLSYQEGYEKIVFSGYSWFLGADTWYPKLCGMVLNLLNKFYSFLPNYGIAIILLTLLVRAILFPLTISQTKSMTKMQEHQPAIKEIKAKHKGNPQKANKAVMEYYREQGVNPMAPMLGCLPMFLQLPVFISLFNVLGRAVELKEAPFFAWISDLSRPDVIVEAVQIPYLFPMGLTVLPFFMAITMYFQMKMTITDPNQKAMVYMMPGMMFLFSASFPSGLVVYWTVSNVFTIGQTWIFKRRKGKTAAVAPAKKGPLKIPQGRKRGKKK